MTRALSSKAIGISRFKKERHLLGYSEDEFRDRVVRPLFLRQGLADGRDLCGPTEEGKDALFVSQDQLGMKDLYVVQTKRGNLNLAGKAVNNVVMATTQLKTALESTYVFVASKEKKLPAKAILCSSGKINSSARRHIADQVGDPRLVFMDADDLIPLVDAHYPEFWLGIDAQIRPYLESLKRALEDTTEEGLLGLSVPGTGVQAAATDEMFVGLKVLRTTWKPVRRKGKIERDPRIDEVPIQAILSRRQRLVLIIGEAGSGKSTTLRRLAYILATRGLSSEQSPVVPVLVRASAVLNAESLVHACAVEAQHLTQSTSAAIGTEDLEGGRVAVFVDALDEVTDDTERSTVLKRILAFSVAYPNCLVVLSSRNYTFLAHLAELKHFTEYRLTPISYKEAKQIIVRIQHNQGLPEDMSQELVRRLQQVHGMELNPLLVTVFAASTDYSRRDLPANITELFKKYTELMLGRWDSTKGLKHQYQAPLKDFILTQLAFEMHRRRVTELDEEEFASLVRGELERRGHKADVSQLLDEVLNRSGLFRVLGAKVEFRHLLLQEFFAGRGVPSAAFLETVLGDEWWQRAIVFYFGSKPGEGESLSNAMRSVASRTAVERFEAAVAVGLALQACYLVEVSQKVDIFSWVVETLAATKDEYLAGAPDGDRFPLTAFILYYLFGRDAAACSVLTDALTGIRERVLAGRVGKDADAREFWLIVGLLECGEIELAETAVGKFKPSDPRYLLAIHLGSLELTRFRRQSRYAATIPAACCRS